MNKKLALITIFTVVALTFLFGYYAVRINVKDTIKSYVPNGDPAKLVYDEVANKFGLNNIVLIGVDFDNVYANFYKIDKITKQLLSLPVVDNVISPVNAPRINVTDDGVSVGDLESTYNFSNYDFDKLKKALSKDNMIYGKFISKNGKSALFVVGLKNDINQKAASCLLMNTMNSFGVKFYMLGAATANVEIEKIVKSNLARLLPLVVLLVMTVLFFSYRTFAGVFLPILAVFFADVWTIGLMEMLKINFNTTTSAIPIAIVGIGTAYSIHIVSRYYEELQRAISPEDAVRESVKHVGLAVVLSALTTIAGFLSLLTADLKPVWQLGIFTSIGIAITLMMATIFVPAILFLIKPKLPHRSSNTVESLFLKRFTYFILKERFLTIAVLIIVVVVMAMFIPRIKSDMQIENFLNKNTQIVQSSIYLRNNFGGNDYLIVDFKALGANSFKDFYYNRVIRDVSKYAELSNIVSQTTNIGDIVANLTGAFTSVAYIPGSESAMAQDYMFIQGSKGIDKILLVKNNESISQIMVNTKSMNKVKELDKALNAFISRYVLSSYSIVPFDSSNPKLIQAFSNEIKEFVLSRGGVFNDSMVLTLVKVRKMPINEVASKLSSKELLDLFNQYLDGNYEDPINLSVLMQLKNGKCKDQDLIDYYEYFFQDYAQAIRSAYAYRLLDNPSYALSHEELMELSQYVNDEQVAVRGGVRKLNIRITGIPVLTNRVNDMVFDNQKESMILAYILVFLLFAIQMHSLIMGILSMIPITLTIIMNFGTMALTRIPLNAATVTIASITIGTGIDYTIHYLTRFKKEYRLYNDKEKAIIKTSSTSGRAIIINSLAVILGFATFIFSNIGMLKQFGILTTAAMMIAPFLTLTIFPITLSMLSDGLLSKFSSMNKQNLEKEEKL